MEPATRNPPRISRIAPIVWAALAVALVGAAAALLFRVPIDQVLSFSFLGLMIVVHVFMHAGGHGGHSHAPPVTLKGRVDDTSAGAGPAHGCH
jgi:hypothetical protein